MFMQFKFIFIFKQTDNKHVFVVNFIVIKNKQ